MQKFIPVSLVLLTVVLAACNGPATYSPPASWVPLSVGNWWVYDVDEMWIEGGDTTLLSYQTETEITDLVEHAQGFQMYEERSILHLNEMEPDTSICYIHQTDTEQKQYYSLTSNYPRLQLSFPLELGKTWYYYSDSLMFVERSVIDLAGAENTPAGSFTECAVVRETWNGDDFGQLSYSRGCGLVKSSFSSDYGAFAYTLHSYNVQ